MLSGLQNFCLKAMGLSHGLAPQKPPIPAFRENTHVTTPLRKIVKAKSEEITPQKIQRLMPKIEVAESSTQKKSTQHIGIAPKDCEHLNDWGKLQTAVKACQYCAELTQARSQTIFGMGNENADLMIISEAPSNDEDIHGHPFVGKAGELLDNMLLAIGIKRENTFITNIVKCQPPNNRDPHKDEAQACEAFINAQINHIKPKLILVLGRIAAHNLLNVKTPVGQLRGETHQHLSTNTPLIISYHPAYLLRNPAQKAKAWDDLKQTHQLLTQND